MDDFSSVFDKLNEAFRLLSLGGADAVPFSQLEMVDRLTMKEILESVGMVFEPEAAIGGLAETQFRGLEQGRGPAFLHILGPTRANLALEFALGLGISTAGRRIKRSTTNEPIDGTQGRGIQQLMADIIAYGVWGEYKYVENINRRVLGGLLRVNKKDEGMVDEIMLNFASFMTSDEKQKKAIPSTMATVRPGVPNAVWQFLTQQEIGERVLHT